MLRLIDAEWMKSRTRWLPYAMLLFLFVGAGIEIWIGGVASYYGERSHYAQNDADFQNASAAFTFRWPYAILPLLDAGQYWGPVFIAFFAASSVATDFGWGSVRLSVTRGVTRTQFLAAKLLTTAFVCAVALLLALAVGIAFSLVATTLVEDPTKYAVVAAVTKEPSLGDIAIMIARSALTILPYGMLAFMLAVISRSTALGATGVLMYKLIEGVLVTIFGSIGGSWAHVQNLFVEHHARALLALNIGDYPEYNTIAFRSIPRSAGTPDPWLSAVMLVLFCVVFGAVSFASFLRRDLNSRE